MQAAALQAQRAANQAILQEQRAAAQAQRAAMQTAAPAASPGAGGGLLSGALAVAGGIGIATSIGAIVSQMKELAVSTVDVAAKMQALRASLSALGGSSSAGAEQFARLFQTAQQLGVAFEPLARGFRSLTAAATQAGLPLEEQMRLLRALATEGRRVGASNEELGRAITAVSQIFSKGVVSMEELRQQLGEAIPTALAAAARGMGVTTAELTKLIETGTLQAVPFAKALTRGFEEIQQAGGKMADGFQQGLARLGNALLALKDAIGQSGLLTYLAGVVGQLRLITEEATSIIRLLGNAPKMAPTGPQLTDMGLSTEQASQLQRLDVALNRARAGVEGARTTQRREELQQIVTELERQREQLIEGAKATTAQADAEAKVKAEANAVTSAKERQVEFTKQVGDAIAKVRQEEEAFRKQAALAPNVLGDPRGTAEQQETFAKERQRALEKSVEALATLAGKPPTGVTLIEEQRKAILGLDIDSKKYGDTVEALKEKEREKARVAREAAAEAKAAAGQALELDTRLVQLRAFGRRPSESPAEEARSRVLVQGQQQIQQLEREIQLLEKSASLRQLRPGALPELRQLRETVRTATDAQAEEAYTEALNKQLSTLDALARKYGFVTQEASDLARAQDEVMKLLGTPLEEAAFERLKTVQDVAAVEAQIVDLRREADATERAGMAAVRLATVTTPQFEQSVTDQLERLRLPREERQEDRLRDEARKRGVTIDENTDRQLRAITTQIQLNELMDTAGRIGESAARAISDGLLSIVDGTKSVSEGFAAMAQSILDSMAKILLDESFRKLFAIGTGILSKALTVWLGGGTTVAPTTTGAVAAGVGSNWSGSGLQHGGVINQPTLALLGENPATSPEYIFNRPQMEHIMRAIPSAGGQAMGGSNISIINVASRGEAEKQAAQERALGRQVIINEVLSELSQGSGSRIAQVLRAGQR
jgi:tape measure domain-containing protein